MNCLSDKKIQKIADSNGFTSKDYIEENIHIKNCSVCSKKIKQYELLEKTLNLGFLIEPPVSITEFVMGKIFTKSPSFRSILLSILFSISTIIFLVFAYYDFAKDSLLRGTVAIGDILLNGLHSLVLFLSGLFDYCIVFIKTINKFTKILLGAGADIELIGLLFIVVLTGIFFTFYKMALKIKL